MYNWSQFAHVSCVEPGNGLFLAMIPTIDGGSKEGKWRNLRTLRMMSLSYVPSNVWSRLYGRRTKFSWSTQNLISLLTFYWDFENFQNNFGANVPNLEISPPNLFWFLITKNIEENVNRDMANFGVYFIFPFIPKLHVICANNFATLQMAPVSL